MHKYVVRNDLEGRNGIIKAGTIVKGKKSFCDAPQYDLYCDDVIELEDGSKFLDLNFEKIKRKNK